MGVDSTGKPDGLEEIYRRTGSSQPPANEPDIKRGDIIQAITGKPRPVNNPPVSDVYYPDNSPRGMIQAIGDLTGKKQPFVDPRLPHIEPLPIDLDKLKIAAGLNPNAGGEQPAPVMPDAPDAAQGDMSRMQKMLQTMQKMMETMREMMEAMQQSIRIRVVEQTYPDRTPSTDDGIAAKIQGWIAGNKYLKEPQGTFHNLPYIFGQNDQPTVQKLPYIPGQNSNSELILLSNSRTQQTLPNNVGIDTPLVSQIAEPNRVRLGDPSNFQQELPNEIALRTPTTAAEKAAVDRLLAEGKLYNTKDTAPTGHPPEGFKPDATVVVALQNTAKGANIG